jgi:hypothetical protein
MAHRFLRLLLAGFLLALCLLAPLPAAAQGPTPAPAQDFVPGQLIVRFRSDVPMMMLASTVLGARLQTIQKSGQLGLELVQVEEGREAELLAQLRANPLVEYAGPNYIAHIAGTPNDPAWWRQWNMRQINMPGAWDISTGSDMIIAVIDTGVDLTHPDLAAKLVAGYNFINNNDSPQDDHGHGTHVAGIAAAITNNALGVAGVAWGARIMPLKVLDANGDGSYYNIIQAIYYAANHGARVINLSLGGSSADPNLLAAIQYASSRGCLVVTAAGNQGGALLYPAAYDEAFAVAATTENQRHPDYSNFGAGVDIAAPGGSETVGIYSLAPGGGYATLYGTSMATPHVAGLAALLWSVNPALTPYQVTRLIEDTATKVGVMPYDANGWNAEMGHGQIDAQAALRRAAGNPQPTPTPSRTATPRPPAPTATPTYTPTPTVRNVEIRLQRGWNLISFNVQPADTRIEYVTRGLGSDLELALGYKCGVGGLSYYPDLPAEFSTLRTLEAGHGYWLKLKTAHTWVVTGTPLAPGASLALCAGWNLAGYLPNQELPVGAALASLGDALVSTLGYSGGQGLSYYADLPPYLNTLQSLEPGSGYWIYTSRPATLAYPAP